MKVEYKLLDNHVGVLLSRQPEVIEDELTICFVGAPSDSVATFSEKGGRPCLRKLTDGECTFPVRKLSGEITVSVSSVEGNALMKWICDELKFTHISKKQTLIAPNDLLLPFAVAELRLENQELRGMVAELDDKIKKLDERLESIMEGYDLT